MRSRFVPALLITLVSLPAFLTGHLLKYGGGPDVAIKMALLTLGVLVVASALMAPRRPE